MGELAQSDVDDFALQLAWVSGGQQIGLHNIFHIGEIAALHAVAVDGDWLVVDEGLAEPRDHATVRELGSCRGSREHTQLEPKK